MTDMDKPIKLVDLSKLTPEQRAALAQFYKDAQAAAPKVEELKQMATRLFRELLRQPRWRVTQADGDPPPAREGWHMGAPTFNDHRHKGDSA